MVFNIKEIFKNVNKQNHRLTGKFSVGITSLTY